MEKYWAERARHNQEWTGSKSSCELLYRGSLDLRPTWCHNEVTGSAQVVLTDKVDKLADKLDKLAVSVQE